MERLARGSCYAAAGRKKQLQSELAQWFRVKAWGKHVTTRSLVQVDFYEPNRKRDPDNVMGGGLKILMDALVEAGVIPDDSPKYVHLSAEVHVAEKLESQRIEVLIDPNWREEK